MAHFHACCPVGTCVAGCETYRTCNGEACDGTNPLAIASYLTIGKPAGNLMFDGPYWAAWHNGITSLAANADVSFKINCYKRTFVQQACGASGCIALPTPSTLVSCVTPAMAADPRSPPATAPAWRLRSAMRHGQTRQRPALCLCLPAPFSGGAW